MQYKGYTIEVVGRTENGNAWLVDIKATKGSVFKTKQFDGIVSIAGLKGAAKSWIDNEDNKTSVPTSGTLDFTEPTTDEVEPTAAELAKAAYDTDREKLRVAMELVRDGVFPVDDTRIKALQAKVRKDFKVEYLG